MKGDNDDSNYTFQYTNKSINIIFCKQIPKLRHYNDNCLCILHIITHIYCIHEAVLKNKRKVFHRSEM